MQTTIVVPLDGSPLGDAAIARAADLARRCGGSLHLVRVHQPVNPAVAAEGLMYLPDPGLDAGVQEEARAWLMRRVNDVRRSSGVTVTAEFRIGMAVEEISAVASASDARIIVCTTHGRGGWAPQWLGSVADGVIRNAASPVLAMSEAAAARPLHVRRMLILLDGFEPSSAILPSARWFARVHDAEIALLRVAAPPWFADVLSDPGVLGDRFGIDSFARTAKDQLDSVAGALRADGFRVTSEVDVSADPPRTILEGIVAADPDVVALATHGRGLSRLFVGSVADKVLRTGARPTLCLRPQRVASGVPVLADYLYRHAREPLEVSPA